MLKFFKPKLRRRPVYLIEPELRAWIYDSFRWALENFDAKFFWRDTQLVKPNDSFFPDRIENEIDLVEKIFSRVKQYAGMSEWKTRLVAQRPGADAKVAPTVAMANMPQTPAGTFSMSRLSGNAKITYDPRHVKEPEKLIATFAHELSHYLATDTRRTPPGGKRNWEFATDLLSVYLGFGIFACNSAYTFRQYMNFDSQGWETERIGYLSQEGLVYSLAVFCGLKEIDRKDVVPFLATGGLKSYFKKCAQDVACEADILSDLKNIKTKRDLDTDGDYSKNQSEVQQ